MMDNSKNPPDLRLLQPRHAIAYALLAAFLLFLSMDLLESALTNQPQFTWLRLVHFIRGFVATSAGMFFVYITMRRKEVELLQLRDHFSETLAKRTTELNQLKQDFLAVISHRLRTPVLANERAALLMKQAAFGPVSEQQSEILQHLIDNNADIKRLLDTLVDIYKYKNDSKDLTRKECSLPDVLNQAVNSVRKQAEAQRVQLTMHTPGGTLWVDGDEAQKLFHHLLENAVKHARSEVVIDSTAVDGCATISITDNGKGMSREDMANLFDRFYQMSSEGTYAPSTGIGLCLCGEIVAAHGGTIVCDSTPGEKTVFTLKLPTHKPA